MKVSGVIARGVFGSALLVLFGEPCSLAVLLSLVMLLPIFDEAPFALACSPLPLPLDDVFHRFSGWGVVELFHETGVGAWPMLSFGVQ